MASGLIHEMVDAAVVAECSEELASGSAQSKLLVYLISSFAVMVSTETFLSEALVTAVFEAAHRHPSALDRASQISARRHAARSADAGGLRGRLGNRCPETA